MPAGDRMIIEQAEAEYNRLKAKESTQEELWAGWRRLVDGMDKINFARNNICETMKKRRIYGHRKKIQV